MMMSNKEFAELIKKMLQKQREENVEVLPKTHYLVNMGINQAVGIINAIQAGEIPHSENKNMETLKAQIIENDRKLRERDERK